MKVLIETAGVGPGGITRFVAELIRHWPSDDDLYVVTADHHMARELDAYATFVTVPGGSRLSSIWQIGTRTERQMRQLSPDVVLSASPSLVSPFPRIPRVVVLHDLFFRLVPDQVSRKQRAYRAFVYRNALTHSRTIICNSRRTQSDLEAWRPQRRAKSVVVPLAPAEVFTAPPRWTGNTGPGRLVVTAHNPLKGSQRLLRALTELPDWSAVLLAGSAERADELTATAESLNLAERVKVEQFLADTTLRELMATSCGLVIPSDIEGFGLPALEALAMDVPVVISPDAALREATDGRASEMSDWSDRSLVTAIERLPDIPEQHWRDAGQWARGRTWADVAREIRDVCAQASVR